MPPRHSALPHATAMRLAATEYARWVPALEALTPDQLTLPTNNSEWDVRAMAGHVVGMTEFAASPLEMMRQLAGAKRAARRSRRAVIDEMTAIQVRKHERDTFDELTRRMREIGPKATAARRRVPAVVRNRRMPDAQPLPSGTEWWTMGFLLDTILTRDPWMHRIDLADATGEPMRLTADHDAVIVADVVAEWAGRHGQPYRLTLTGPAGGEWSNGTGGEHLELDALEFCLAVSHRRPAEGLLATFVPF